VEERKKGLRDDLRDLGERELEGIYCIIVGKVRY